MRTTSKLVIFVFTFLILAASAYAQSPREELQQMVEQLQKSPGDNALREKIIKLAINIEPTPVIPEEAERHMAYGTAAFQGAKSSADFKESAKEFEQATLAAPWYGDAYFNLGVAQDKAENYEAALRSLNLAQLASPGSKDIKALIYQVEYRDKKFKLIKEEEAKGPAMVRIPGKNYEIGKTEVTQGEWKAIMGNNPSHFSSCGDTCPVEQVSWNDTQEFIQKLNQKTGKQYRLPSEAEWENACRAGRQQKFCGSDSVDSVAWYGFNSGRTTHPVARKQPNAFGLYDMNGNVAEWVEDCYNENCAWGRVLRGFSWYNFKPEDIRADRRFNNEPAYRDMAYGFRLARTLP